MVSSAIRSSLLILGCLLLWSGRIEAAVPSDKDFKLKKGARAKVCVGCHDEFDEVLKRRHLHTPLSKGSCTGCHDPHASNEELLLAASSGALCYQCHDELEKPTGRSVHEVFAEGKCVECHDPHSSNNRMILVKAGSGLCFDCHKELGEAITGAEFEHDPVEDDCLECHTPHVAEKNPKLLRDDQPSLCLECHKVGGAKFKRLHRNYPVETRRCTSCHNPHGSSTEALLFDNVHDPVSEGECDRCHLKATASSPLSLKDSGYQICEGCHYEDIAEMFLHPRVHWALLDRRGCINCHAPHGSANEALLRDPMIGVCETCHRDTVDRQERAQTKHPPVADGECTECHSPHGSESLFLLNDADVVNVCGECHEWQMHSTHPIGAEVIDPRNENVNVECSSCHRSHGTEYKHFIYFENKDDLCVQCHIDYRR